MRERERARVAEREKLDTEGNEVLVFFFLVFYTGDYDLIFCEIFVYVYIESEREISTSACSSVDRASVS